MKVEEFAKTTPGELAEKANDCFARAETAGTLDRPGLLIEARFYIDEIERREHARISKRDFVLEVAAIALEVIVVILIGLELRGGVEQLAVLDKTNANVGETARILGSLRDSQQAALETQKESLRTIGAMNEAQQKQLAMTGKMSESLRRQVEVLAQEQARRVPRSARDRQLYFWVEGVPVTPDTMRFVGYRERSPSEIEFTLAVGNQGLDSIPNLTIQAYAASNSFDPNSAPLFAPQVQLRCECSFRGAGRSIFLDFDRIRQGEIVDREITATFPQDYGSFNICFNVFGENVSQTHLGCFYKRPVKQE